MEWYSTVFSFFLTNPVFESDYIWCEKSMNMRKAVIIHAKMKRFRLRVKRVHRVVGRSYLVTGASGDPGGMELQPPAETERCWDWQEQTDVLTVLSLSHTHTLPLPHSLPLPMCLCLSPSFSSLQSLFPSLTPSLISLSSHLSSISLFQLPSLYSVDPTYN